MRVIMRKSIITLVFCVLLFGAVSALADELTILDPLFVPRAIIDSDTKIMDSTRWIVGTIDMKGFVFNAEYTNIGMVKMIGDEAIVRDVHYGLLADVDEEGVMTGPGGEVIGHVSETRVTDADGRVIFRLKGPMQRRGLVVYLIFFSGKF